MQHTRTKTGGVVTYDYADWRAGLAPFGKFTSGPSGNRFTGTLGATRISQIDPFYRSGVLCPGQGASANATNFASLGGVVVAGERKSDSIYIGLDLAGKIHEITTTGAAAVVTTGSYPYQIAGTNPVGQDGIFYKHNNGATTTQTTSFFASYYNSANWDIAVQVDVTGTPDYDFMSSIPATPLDITTGDGDDTYQRTQAHPMEIGSDDILYIGSGRYLHAYDGATGINGTFSSKVLTLPAGFQIVALKKNQDKLYIVGNYYSTDSTSETGVALCYVWDYQELDPSTVIPLEDSLVSAVFIWRGAVTVVTSGAILGRNGRNKVKVISGTSLVKLADFDGTLPRQRGIVVENEIIYMNCGGRIISVGDKTMKSNAINNIGNFSSATTSGVLFYNFSNTTQPCFTGSTSIDTTYYFGNLNNGMASGSYRSTYFTPDFPLNMQGKIKAVYVQYDRTLTAGGSNGDITIQLVVDLTTTVTIVANKSSVAVPLIKRHSLDASNANFPQFSGFEVLFNWNAGTANAPCIAKLIIEYEDVQLLV